jgi:hypothetical protein
MEHTFDVDVHDFLPLLCSGLHQRRSHRDARVRHHDVQAAEVPDVSRHGRVNARRIGDIYSEVKSNFRAAEAGGHRLCVIHCGRQVCHRDSKTVRRKPFGDRSSNPPRAASDHSRPVGAHRPILSKRSVLGPDHGGD